MTKLIVRQVRHLLRVQLQQVQPMQQAKHIALTVCPHHTVGRMHRTAQAFRLESHLKVQQSKQKRKGQLAI